MSSCVQPAWWLPYVQPFATLILGLGAAALAYRQWLTADAKLRLDLYDRRQRFLTAFRSHLDDLERHGVENFDPLDFRGSIIDDKHLFAGKQAKTAFARLDKLSSEIFSLKARLKRATNFDAEDDLRDELSDASAELAVVAKPLSSHLETYLEFTARGVRHLFIGAWRW